MASVPAPRDVQRNGADPRLGVVHGAQPRLPCVGRQERLLPRIVHGQRSSYSAGLPTTSHSQPIRFPTLPNWFDKSFNALIRPVRIPAHPRGHGLDRRRSPVSTPQLPATNLSSAANAPAHARSLQPRRCRGRIGHSVRGDIIGHRYEHPPPPNRHVDPEDLAIESASVDNPANQPTTATVSRCCGC